jgi:osmoprotectant transport system ATP-binding protein
MSGSAGDNWAIEFRDAGYSINGQRVLENVSLAVRQGETLVLLGQSGSGKTSALKLVNGLRLAHSGDVLVEGKSIAAWDPIALRRHIGYVIQETGLFPHFTVAQNVALVPRLARWPEQRIRARVEEMLELVGLGAGGFAARYPHELSGGQRQRVGVARALAADPPILLMDEPFGDLDALTRAALQKQFQQLQRSLAKTILFVTHDVHEALLLATRIALMDHGTIVGIYTPQQFLETQDRLPAAYVAALRVGHLRLG